MQGTEADIPYYDWVMDIMAESLATALLACDALTRIDNMLLLMDKELARENGIT